MFTNAPRPFLLLLALVTASRLFVGVSSGGSWIPALLWTALIAALSLNAIYGKRSAAKLLGYTLYVLGALSLLIPLTGANPSIYGFIALVLWGVLAVGTARYIFRSSALEAFYASGSRH